MAATDLENTVAGTKRELIDDRFHARSLVDHAQRAAASGLRSFAVEALQQLMGGKLELLVPPFGGSVLTSDQAHPVNPPEVSVDECVTGFGLVGRTVGEAQMPLGVFVPGMRLEEFILVLCARLNVAPHAVEHVLARVDELSCSRHRALIDRVRGDSCILSDRWARS